MKKPVVILYSECLSSYLLYSEFVQEHPDLVECLIEFPPIPRSRKGRRRASALPMIKRIVQRSSFSFLWLNWFTILFYRMVATVFRKRLRDLARRLDIPVIRAKTIDKQLLSRIRSLQPAWIMNNSANILGRSILAIPARGTLNYHCAPLPEYRGAANYFWVVYEQEPETRATLHYVVEKLDAGDVICYSRRIPIEPNMSVFRLWYRVRLEGYRCIQRVLPCLGNGHAIPATPQDESAARTRSFPGREVSAAIRKNGHGIINWRDIATIWIVARTGTIPRAGEVTG